MRSFAAKKLDRIVQIVVTLENHFVLNHFANPSPEETAETTARFVAFPPFVAKKYYTRNPIQLPGESISRSTTLVAPFFCGCWA